MYMALIGGFLLLHKAQLPLREKIDFLGSLEINSPRIRLGVPLLLSSY